MALSPNERKYTANSSRMGHASLNHQSVSGGSVALLSFSLLSVSLFLDQEDMD